MGGTWPKWFVLKGMSLLPVCKAINWPPSRCWPLQRRDMPSAWCWHGCQSSRYVILFKLFWCLCSCRYCSDGMRVGPWKEVVPRNQRHMYHGARWILHRFGDLHGVWSRFSVGIHSADGSQASRSDCRFIQVGYWLTWVVALPTSVWRVKMS